MIEYARPRVETSAPRLAAERFFLGSVADRVIRIAPFAIVTRLEANSAQVLTRALELDPDVVVIMITGHGSVESAVDAMRAGVLDCLLKPLPSNDVLRLAVERAAKRRRPRGLRPCRRQEPAMAAVCPRCPRSGRP